MGISTLSDEIIRMIFKKIPAYKQYEQINKDFQRALQPYGLECENCRKCEEDSAFVASTQNHVRCFRYILEAFPIEKLNLTDVCKQFAEHGNLEGLKIAWSSLERIYM